MKPGQLPAYIQLRQQSRRKRRRNTHGHKKLVSVTDSTPRCRTKNAGNILYDYHPFIGLKKQGVGSSLAERSNIIEAVFAITCAF